MTEHDFKEAVADTLEACLDDSYHFLAIEDSPKFERQVNGNLTVTVGSQTFVIRMEQV